MLVSKKELCQRLGISARHLKGKLTAVLDMLQISDEAYRKIKVFDAKQSITIRRELNL